MNDPSKPPDKPKQAQCCVCHQPFTPYMIQFSDNLGDEESEVCWNCDWALLTYLENLGDDNERPKSAS